MFPIAQHLRETVCDLTTNLFCGTDPLGLKLQLLNQQQPPPSKCPPGCMYVPFQLRNSVLQWVHPCPGSRHPEVAANACLLATHYWWPGWRGETGRYFLSCSICAQSKSHTHSPYAATTTPYSYTTLVPLSPPVGMLPSIRSWIICQRSKKFLKCHLIPLP